MGILRAAVAAAAILLLSPTWPVGFAAEPCAAGQVGVVQPGCVAIRDCPPGYSGVILAVNGHDVLVDCSRCDVRCGVAVWICPSLAASSTPYGGPVWIHPTGDVVVGGVTVYDCPPYEL